MTDFKIQITAESVEEFNKAKNHFDSLHNSTKSAIKAANWFRALNCTIYELKTDVKEVNIPKTFKKLVSDGERLTIYCDDCIFNAKSQKEYAINLII